ncbi:hypothetical protein [Actinoallomurus acanthiterrae]
MLTSEGIAVHAWAMRSFAPAIQLRASARFLDGDAYDLFWYQSRF